MHEGNFSIENPSKMFTQFFVELFAINIAGCEGCDGAPNIGLLTWGSISNLLHQGLEFPRPISLESEMMIIPEKYKTWLWNSSSLTCLGNLLEQPCQTLSVTNKPSFEEKPSTIISSKEEARKTFFTTTVYDAVHRLDYTSDPKENISQGHCSNKLYTRDRQLRT